MGQFIPAGRTSLAKYGNSNYQLQTEYARRPRPRITTSISIRGRVLHKVEKLIDSEVESIEDMHQIEDLIKTQHIEVTKILRERGLPAGSGARESAIGSKIKSEQIAKLGEVEEVYLVAANGTISGNKEMIRAFKKSYKHIVKELPDMLKVFSKLPGQDNRREEGIYEADPERIILASTGSEFYLILLKAGAKYAQVSTKLKQILIPK